MKKTVLLSLSTAVIAIAAAIMTLSGTNTGNAIISPALDVIAEYTPMCKSGIAGNEILFVAEDFERALNVSSVSSITVNKLPEVTDGKLMIGSTAVKEGQNISRENISLLSYAAANDDARNGSFEFSANGMPYSLKCSVYLLDGINYSPTTKSSSASKTVSTYNDISAFGQLYSYDPEGDKVTYQITSYPKNGIVMLVGDDGRYVYMPNKGYTGNDSLTYVVYDKYGNYSSSSTVKLKVNKNITGTVYNDLMWNDCHASAIRMTEAGIMSGEEKDGKLCFSPDNEVSREEFLVMAMRSAGINNLPTVSNTGFDDDGDISDKAKAYVSAAYKSGFVSGTLENGKVNFKPDECISYAEAVYTLSKILDVKNTGTSIIDQKTTDIPAWAENAVNTMYQNGIINTIDVDFNSYITRGQTAVLLCNVIK